MSPVGAFRICSGTGSLGCSAAASTARVHASCMRFDFGAVATYTTASARASSPSGGPRNWKASFAAKAIERFGSPALRQLLDDTKVGEHPEIAKFMIKVGKQIAEDTLAEGKGGKKQEPKSDGELFYPNMNEEVRKARAANP